MFKEIKKSNQTLTSTGARGSRPSAGTAPSWPAMVAGILGLLTLFLAGCQTGVDSDKGPVTCCHETDADAPTCVAPPKPGTADYATNILTEADVVSVEFRYSTNYNTVQKISLDGTLNLVEAGRVKAAGKSLKQLEADITELYKGKVTDDPVLVKISSTAGSVYVSGAVTRPGRVLMERPMTVMEALVEAGGYDPYRAKLSSVVVLRVEDGQQKTYKINVNRMLEGKEDAPFYLKPFDVLQVPTKTFNF